METSQNGSTNNTQEENIKDLTGGKAIEKLRELAEKAESCFFAPILKLAYRFRLGQWRFNKWMMKEISGL